MKFSIIILLALLALAGCDRRISAKDRDTWFLEDASEALSEIDFTTPEARDLLSREQTLKFLTAALNPYDEQVDFSIPAAQFDARVTEQLAVEFALCHLESLEDKDTYVGGEIDYNSKVDFFQVLTGLDVKPLVQEYYQRQAIDSLLYRHARTIANDKVRLTNYYSDYRQAVLNAIYAYEVKNYFAEESTLVARLIEVRQGFAAIATAEGRQQIADLLQEEERFDTSNWHDLRGEAFRKADEERQRLYQRSLELSPALFAYRRYTQSDQDLELIHAYITLLDDFIPALDKTLRLATERRRAKERAMAENDGAGY